MGLHTRLFFADKTPHRVKFKPGDAQPDLKGSLELPSIMARRYSLWLRLHCSQAPHADRFILNPSALDA